MKSLCSLCLRPVSDKLAKRAAKHDSLILCKVCRRRHTIDDRGFIRKKRNRKSRSKFQRNVRLMLFDIFNKTELCEDVHFPWNRSLTNALLEYDFYLPKYNAVVEVQGEHHYKCVGKYKMTKADLSDVKYRDKMKKEAAKKNGLYFYEVRYDDIIRDKVIEIHNDLIKKRRKNK